MDDLNDKTSAVLSLIESLGAARGRLIVGIVGPPASGKSTLAARVVEGLVAREGAATAALVPMDGFHLPNEVLDERGLRDVKGAPETFDADGFVALVRDIKAGGRDIRYPLFERDADCTLPDAALLPRDTRVVVVEGNYLLLRAGSWPCLKPLFDATVMINAPLEVLEARLVERWLMHGLDQGEAKKRARGNDLSNARHVLGNSAESDLILTNRADRGIVPPANTQKERPE